MRAQMWEEEPQWPWGENHGLPGFLVIDNNATMLVMGSFALAQSLESKSLCLSGRWSPVWRMASHLRSSQVSRLQTLLWRIMVIHTYMSGRVKINTLSSIGGSLRSVLWSISRREMVTKQTEGYGGQQQEEEEEIMVFQVLMLWPSDAIIIPILNFNIINTRLVPLSLLLVSFSQPLTKLLSLSEFSRSFHHI